MDLYAECLDVVCSVRSPGEVAQIELDLVPAFIQSHWHGANERFHSCCGLVVGCAEPSPDVLVIEHLHFECEVLFEVLDDHDEEWQFDAESFVCVCGARYVVGRDIGAHDFKHAALDVGVGDSLDVAIAHTLVPDLKGLRSI